MRIISKFRDYYDSAAGYGIDPDLVYRREPEYREVLERLWKWDSLAIPFTDHFYGDSPLMRSVVLGFCGRVFPYWIDEEVEFTAESVTNEAAKWKGRTSQECTDRILALADEPIWDYSAAEMARKVEYFASRSWGQRIETAVFRDLGCPLFLLSRVEKSWDGFSDKIGIVTNPKLANLGFQHVLDSFSAFQEIATFLGTMVTKEDEAPARVGNDEIIAQSKGFDKMSFRTPAPGNKKLNRKLNRERKRKQP